MKAWKSVITGGAGFIGSHLAESLLGLGSEVTIIDNFSNGRKENISHLLGNPLLKLAREDLKNPSGLQDLVKEYDIIFHLAANPEVRVGETSPRVHFEENILATFNMLESIRPLKESKTIVFASTSTVYGDATQIPTPESYGPLQPISTYGASKLACEALIASYASTFNHRGLILRLANIIGPRANHGVIVDFIRKISENSKQLEILGDGTQNKSYLHVNDCVEAIVSLTSLFRSKEAVVDVFNVGSKDQIAVKEIARIVARKMDKPNIKYAFTGGIDGGRGWKGDVKHMNLSIDKLLKTGWKPRYNSREAVELTAAALLDELVMVRSR